MRMELAIQVPQAVEEYFGVQDDMIIKTVDLNGYEKGSVVGIFKEGYSSAEFHIRLSDLTKILKHFTLMEQLND